MTRSRSTTDQNAFRKKPDGEKEPAAEVGWYLQRERETLGYSLTEVASELRVDPTYLHALEQGELHHQLGWTYVLSYVRSYSDYLGFEPGPVIKHYKDILADEGRGTSPTQSNENWPFNEVRARAAIATFAGVVGLMGLAGLALNSQDATAENSAVDHSPKELSDVIKSLKSKTSFNINNRASFADIPEVAIRQVPLHKAFDEKKSQAAIKNLTSLSLARLAAVSEN